MLKIFEAFAGYGSQRMAIKRLNIEYESVGISEIEESVINSYAYIHEDLEEKIKTFDQDYPNITKQEMVEFLENINVPLNYKTFKNMASKLPIERLKKMYLANKLSKNYGDISKINPDKLPYFDLFTYSFPCQDISIAGKQQGFKKDSGTRSSLLWECCKIIETVKPKYLLMENVKNLVSKKNIKYFNDFLKYLESVGYTNYWQVLNAKDYGGIPQNRERVFCVSIRNDLNQTFEFPEKQKLNLHLKDLLENSVDSKYYLSKKMLEGFKIRNMKNLNHKSVWQFKTTDQDFSAKTITTEEGQRIGDNFINGIIIQIGELNLGNNESNNRVYDTDGISPTLNTMQGGHRQPKILTKGVDISAVRGRYIEGTKNTEQNLEINKNKISNTITSVQKDNYVIESYIARKYNEFYEKNGYIPEVFNAYDCYDVGDVSATVLTTVGNGTSISSMLISEKHSINKQISEGYDILGFEIDGKIIGVILINNTLYFIRKLTPKECFRLMGVSDTDFDKIKNLSDSSLYRQAGNSIVVNVLENIFKKIFIK